MNLRFARKYFTKSQGALQLSLKLRFDLNPIYFDDQIGKNRQ
jgi:hypothetical protein